MLAKATEVRPDLVVLEMASDLPAGLDTAEKLKRTLPHVPLFLVTPEHTMAWEKEALHRGIDAVFKSDDGLTSVVMKARAMCGLEWQSRNLFRSLTQSSLPFLRGVGALAPTLNARLYFALQPPRTPPYFLDTTELQRPSIAFGGLHVISFWRIGGGRR
jgi:hypothetical protein